MAGKLNSSTKALLQDADVALATAQNQSLPQLVAAQRLAAKAMRAYLDDNATTPSPAKGSTPGGVQGPGAGANKSVFADDGAGPRSAQNVPASVRRAQRDLQVLQIRRSK
jgi:hypothetical protein